MVQGQLHRGRTLPLLLGILALVAALTTATPAWASVNGAPGCTLDVKSVGEEFIGRGQEYHFTNGAAHTADFTGSVSDEDHDGQVDQVVVVVFDRVNIIRTTSREWSIFMSTASMKKPLIPGTYASVVEPRKADGKAAALDIGAYGRGCGASPVVSFFTISDIKVVKNVNTGAWELARLVANWRFRCGAVDDRPEDPTGLTGDINFIGDVVGAGETPGGGGSGGPPPPPADVTFVLPPAFSEEDFTGVNMSNSSSTTVDFDVAVTSSFNEPVFLSAVSDPEGLDLSVEPAMLPAPGSGKGHVTIRTNSTTFPRDYRVDLIGTTTSRTFSSSFLVSLNCDPPQILGLGQPHSGEVTRGNVATLDVNAVGTGPFSYQWYSGSTGQTSFPLAGATGRTFTSSGLNDTGYYWVRVSNPCGSVDSQTATINVRTPSGVPGKRH